MRAIKLVVRTEKGEFPARLQRPDRKNIQEAIGKFYMLHDEPILSLWVEMPYEDQGEKHTFRYEVEEPGLSAGENASWIWHELENFRY